MIKLSIVALSYNTKDLTLACLKSVVSQYKQKLEKKEFEVIVVDNNSSDNSVAEISNLKSQVSNLIIIQNKENLGFGKGCNLGAKSAKGKYVLFLNSDTQVFDKGFLSMIDFLDKNSNVAVLGGKLENNDGSIQRSCGKFYNLFNLLIMLLGLERFGFLRSSPNKIQKVDWVSGACMMVRADIFEKLTGFDEKLFMYMEDMEICFRANKLGFVTYFYPNVKLKHKSLGSSNRTFAIINIYKGILYFYSKHKTHLEYLVAKLFLITKAGILILVGLLTFNSELRGRYQKAISENL
ncbi:MAG: hypothetical protein A3H17_00935 [Candidatus Levybacteria bacterium RIFCSPLOWO2_12_FULL_37_14]|nr:MAG: hypothetical protein A3H17_00935 [Candidatus Levybacteria bacterium RIFCSPLOWO2_12_FULL_37_14]